MAGHNVGFMFGINIEGYDEVSSLTDKFDENKPAGSAFTVAELLNKVTVIVVLSGLSLIHI